MTIESVLQTLMELDGYGLVIVSNRDIIDRLVALGYESDELLEVENNETN